MLSFCLLTTGPNDPVRRLHDRMPAILRPDEFDLWLDREAEMDDVRPLLEPCPADEMAALPPSPRINSSRNGDPACLNPLRAKTSSEPRRSR